MQQEDIGLQHYVDVLWRRKWAIGVVFTIVFSLCLIAIALSQVTYKVHSKVAVKNQIYYRTSMFAFAPGTDAPGTTLSGESYEEIINGLPFSQRVADFLLSQGRPLDAMEVRASLKAEYQEPDLIKIHASNKDSALTVLLANAAADVFVEDTKTLVRENLLTGRESAVERQDKARQEIKSIEDEIAQFRRQMGFVDISSEMDSLRAKIASFEQARGELITKLEIQQTHKQELLNLAKVGAAGDLYLDDPRIEEYRQLQEDATKARIKYTEDHPALRNLTTQLQSIEARLKDTIARAGSNLSPEAFLTLKEDLAKTEGEVANLQTGIDSWNRQIAEVRKELERYPDRLSGLQNLEGQLAAAQESFKMWSSRIEEIDFKASKIPANAELVDRAIAPIPTMSKGTAAVLAVILSVMLALGTGFLVEFSDTTLRTPEEITSAIGLGYLGSIVKLKETDGVVFADGKPVNQVAESYLRVYTNLKFAEVERPFRTVLITSARKGEGKSTTLVNLACAISGAGKKVIIVDTDLRNPSLQRILRLKHQKGLTSVLAGEATLDEAVRPAGHPNLTILPAGPIPPNPAELLHSDAMKQIIRQLESRADLVIFDSPPALLVADAMLLIGELQAAIIVTESGGISRKAVQQVKDTLLMSKARILGVILNKIQDSPAAYYNYYSYYKYYKEPEGEETAAVAAKPWFKGGLGLRKSGGGRS